ncbi:hypothetical protein [Catenulispora subtropica]|uniref:Glycosyltransferase RgtA/B/C/D-like domain-containing protein n=1 Tax=Catenulispora subtropica TaxID=450798 RepID=A0ABN2S2R7_9ACTN
MSADTAVAEDKKTVPQRRRPPLPRLPDVEGLVARLMSREVFGVQLGVLLAILPVFVLSIGFGLVSRQGWNHPPDSRYYLPMMAKDMGHPWAEAVRMNREISPNHVAPWFFAENDPTWQMVRTRLLYPVLSIPFIWMWGLSGGSMAIPVLGDILFLWATARVVQRLYGPAITIIVVGAFSTVGPIFGFAWAGTDTLGMGLAAVIVANLPIERRIGKANLAWLGIASVFIALTRQVGVLAPAMAGAGWLWALARERTWRNRWLGSLVVTSAVTLFLQVLTMMLVKTDTVGVLGRGQTTYWGIFRQFVHYLKIVTQEAVSYMWNEQHVLLGLFVAAGVTLVVRFKSDAAAVFLGAAASTYLITAGLGFSTLMRYEMIMFPATAVAAGGLVQLMLGQYLPGAVPRQAAESAAVAARAAGIEADADGADTPLPRRGTGRLGLGLGLARSAPGRFLGLDQPREERWKPHLILGSIALAIVVGISVPGSWRSTPTAPAQDSYAAAQGGTPFAVTPLAKPDAITSLVWAFNQATEVANGHGMLDGSFDWVHDTRYRPTGPKDPGWATRDKDGTTIMHINATGMDQPAEIAFGNAVTLNRTVNKDTIHLLSRKTSEYGEDVVFTVEDKFGKVHQGRATTLYPIWEKTAPGLVTALIFDS